VTWHPDHDRRVESLKSVLPLLELHLDLISRVKSALGNVWESEPSPLDEPRAPRLWTPDIFCRCQCATCPDREECRDEPWVLMAVQLRRAYRLDVIADALVDLARTEPDGRLWAAAVYWEYVDPWERWNPEMRAIWSREGLDWLAESIRGPLFPFQVGDGRQTMQMIRNEEIVRLREAGLSYHKIAKTIGCSKSTVAAALSGKRVR